jgi:putative aminopeptidase FrvX
VSVTRNETASVQIKLSADVNHCRVHGVWRTGEREVCVAIGNRMSEGPVEIADITNIRALAAHLTAFCDAVEKETP